MPYVITGTCTKDEHSIETCPANCIHPTKDEPDFATAAQLYVNPTECIDRVVLATRSARLPRFSIWRNCRRNCRNLFKRKPLTLTKRCLTRPKAHRPPSRGELSFLECVAGEGTTSPAEESQFVVNPSQARDLLFAKCQGKRRFLTPQIPFGMTKGESFRSLFSRAICAYPATRL